MNNFHKLTLVLTLTHFYYPTLSQPSIRTEEMFSSVVYIEGSKIKTQQEGNVLYDLYLYDAKTNSGKPFIESGSGTGFLIGTGADDRYLVTAAHVANATKLNTLIKIASKNGFTISISLKNLVENKFLSNGQTNWIYHPKEDVAIVPIKSPSLLVDSSLVRYIPYDAINDELYVPNRELELTVFGFPLGLGVQSRISPISKKYHVASGLIDLLRSDTNTLSPFFLIDDPSISGLSGGPLFALNQQISHAAVKANLVGLVHGVISANQAGYGAIVPSKFIVETIQMAPPFSGLYTYRYKNGIKWSEVMFKNGLPWSVISNFDNNGLSQNMGTLLNGTGSRNIYDESGKLISIHHYKNGRLIDFTSH